MLKTSMSKIEKRKLSDLFSKAFQKCLKRLGRHQINCNMLFVNGNVNTNKNRIAEIFNDFLVKVGSNLSSKIPKGKRPFNTYLRKSVVNSFLINLVQDSEVEKLINNLNKQPK